MKNGIRAAIYARYSSDNQREESITAQLRACNEYAKRKGYIVVREFTDEEYSARTDNRPAFQEMINAAKADGFDVLICHKIDRFARDRYDDAYYKRILKKAGVTIEYVEQNIDGSPESIILESVLVGMAEYYSRNLAREALKGMRENAYQAKHNGGKPPLGYDVDKDQKYIINEQEAAIVRYIFNRYAEGITYGQLIAELDNRGWQTKTGGRFGKNSLHDLLKNQKYIGNYTFGRVVGGRSEKRNNHKNDEKMIVIDGAIPAIVDKATWDAVQERMKSREKKGAQHAKQIYLLSGLVYCSCGCTMVGNRFTSKISGVYSYYQCNRRMRQNTQSGCTAGKVKKEWLEALVLAYLQDNLFSEEGARAFVNKINQAIEVNSTNHRLELDALEKEKTGILKKIDNLLSLAEAGEIDDLLKERLKQNKNRLNTINFRLTEIQATAGANLLTEEQMYKILESWRNATTPEEHKAMFQTFVDYVVVMPENVEVQLKVKTAAGNVHAGGIVKRK